MKGLPTVALAGLLLVPGCLNVERASACRELSASLKESFGTERTLETAEDVKGFVAELEALEARIEPWLTSPTWQGSDLTVFSVELGVLKKALSAVPPRPPTTEGPFGRRISDSVRRLEESAGRLRIFCSAP
jgi:hypothetical protein